MAELICPTSDRDAWLAARREGITATDIGVILGLVTWDSPFTLYWRKKGKLPEVEASDRMRLGSWLEESVAENWRAGSGAWATNHGWSSSAGLYQSSARPWQLATPDRLVYDGIDHVVAVLECKTSATHEGWGPGYTEHDIDGRPVRVLDDGQVPPHIRAQVLWQMDTLGVPVGHVAVVFLPSGEFRSYTINHDVPDELTIGADRPDACLACKDIDLMRVAAFQFWTRLVHEKPPPVDGLQVTTDALRHLNADAVKGKTAEVPIELWNSWYGAGLEADRWARLKRSYENEMRQAMGDATVATVAGGPVARREVFKNPGYTVSPFEVDRLVRVKPKEDKGDG